MLANLANRLIPLAVLSLGAAALSARASVIVSAGDLDQQHVVDHTNFGGFAMGIEAPHPVAQTFTVGRSGLLSRLELQAWRVNQPGPTEPLFAQFRRTLGDGSPDPSASALLATVTFEPSEVTHGWFNSAFSGKDLGEQTFPVEAGDRLAIVVRTTQPQNLETGALYGWSASDWRAADPNVDYPGGMSLVSAFGGPFEAHPQRDVGFRTFVTVPEPTTLIMAAPAVLLLSRRTRR